MLFVQSRWIFPMDHDRRDLFMAARILHFGQDTCHRLFVLRSAGYGVAQCGSVFQLRKALLSDGETDAVLMANSPEDVSLDAIAVARSYSTARLILFRDVIADTQEEDFDLVIPPLTPPIQWLNDIAILIERSRALRVSSAELMRKSEILRMQSAVARQKSEEERARSARMQTPSAEKLAGSWGMIKADDGDK